jgi:serine/threonine protein kinase
MIPKVVLHYRILEQLGSGGMGVVYKAEDTHLHRFVALKFLPDTLTGDPQTLERFQREAHAASALDSANICTVCDICEFEGQPFIAMQYLEGQTLHERIRAAPWRAPRCWRWQHRLPTRWSARTPKALFTGTSNPQISL